MSSSPQQSLLPHLQGFFLLVTKQGTLDETAQEEQYTLTNTGLSPSDKFTSRVSEHSGLDLMRQASSTCLL